MYVDCVYGVVYACILILYMGAMYMHIDYVYG